MIKKLFGIKDDGVLVAKERIEKWTYTKYPPKSKFILWQNIKLILLLIILLIICNIIVIKFDDSLTIPFICCDLCFVTMIIGAIWGAKQQWKLGKYWNNNE